MQTMTDWTSSKINAAARSTIAVSLCPRCLCPNVFSHTGTQFVWTHCGETWSADETVVCPHSSCRQSFRFQGQAKCPHCEGELDSGVPLRPIWHVKGILDVVLPSRRTAGQQQREVVEDEFDAVFESWCRDSRGESQCASGTQFAHNLKATLHRHRGVLDQFGSDLDKFLYSAPVKLARLEGEYSWKFEEAVCREIDDLLEGVLSGRNSVEQSLGFLVRCYGDNPRLYSRRFLTEELRRKFHERRSAPKPGFQLTLEYAKTLDGIGFEEWLVRLLKDAGIQHTHKTQDSRDQGADVIVEMAGRKIAIQAKQVKDTLGNACVQEALAGRHFYHADEAWVVTTSTFSKDAIELAYRTGVQLVDGSRLMNLPAMLLGSPTPAATQMTLPDQQRHQEEIPAAAPVKPPVVIVTSIAAAAKPQLDPPEPTIENVAEPLPEVPPQRGRSRRVWAAVACLLLLFGVYRVYVFTAEVKAKREIQDVLDRYQDAIRSKNTQVLADCYAPTVESFYLKHNVSRGDVHAEFRRQLAGYTSVEKFVISNIEFRGVTGDRATVVDDKEWSFKGPKNNSGSEREELVFRKVDGEWRIVSQIELNIYWYRRN